MRSDSPVVHPQPSLDVLATQSKIKKLLLLTIFCFAFFLDTVNNSSLFTAIPVISTRLDIPNSRSVWLLSAYQLTFAALPLISGRVSDLYNPKWVFITGALSMGVFSLIAGFIRKEIPLLVLRGLMGAGGALTIPSAMHLIVHMYLDPAEQAKAVTAFGGMGAIGIVLGLVIDAVFLSFASWPWVFYFAAIVAAVLGASGFLVPGFTRTTNESRAEKILRFRRLDLLGVFLFTAASILFIFSITSGSIAGWGSAQVIAPLVISLMLVLAFFLWESRLPESYAAVPSKMWKYENFKVLVLFAFAPFAWWSSIFLQFSWLWEVVYQWSAIKTAVHFLPIGLGMFPGLLISAQLQARLGLKWVIFIGFVLVCIGTVLLRLVTILLPFADSAARYWRFAFPGFLLGTIGAALVYTATSVALLANTPKSVSGIVSAIFICVLQMGGAIGSAILASIQTSVQISHGGPTSFTGRAAGLWFLFAFMCAMTALLLLLFMKDTVDPADPKGAGHHNVEKDTTEGA
ncbi:major facilitator superfamily domain-containing protein [Mycena alexandri]|uniref:Major facilitator superfamily domain-containing protein n=1 Tax=Mycena alexandri TaxID=1745969 RepID=A0AAD6WQ53_9AGAR|nr:major facilitator superfamily domain-containing protein [Mycena alexandri]